jgi:hypothetical protein
MMWEQGPCDRPPLDDPVVIVSRRELIAISAHLAALANVVGSRRDHIDPIIKALDKMIHRPRTFVADLDARDFDHYTTDDLDALIAGLTLLRYDRDLSS